MALIFNQQKFDCMTPLPGSAKDCEDLSTQLKALVLKIWNHEDLIYTELSAVVTVRKSKCKDLTLLT
jgi:hypothetical protein